MLALQQAQQLLRRGKLGSNLPAQGGDGAGQPAGAPPANTTNKNAAPPAPLVGVRLDAAT
jgi:hypothetical protein